MMAYPDQYSPYPNFSNLRKEWNAMMNPPPPDRSPAESEQRLASFQVQYPKGQPTAAQVLLPNFPQMRQEWNTMMGRPPDAAARAQGAQGAQLVPGYTSPGEMDQQAATYTASAPPAPPKPADETLAGLAKRIGGTDKNGLTVLPGYGNNTIASGTSPKGMPMFVGYGGSAGGATGGGGLSSGQSGVTFGLERPGMQQYLAQAGGAGGPYFPQLQGRGPQTSELTDAIRATSDIINQYKGRSDWTSREMTAKAIDRLANLQSAQTQAFQAGTGAQQANTQQMYQVGPNGQGGMLGVERERAAMMAPYYAGAGQGSLMHGQAALGQAVTQRQVSAPQIELNNRVVELLAAGKPDEAMQLMRASKGEFNTMQIPVATGTYVSPPPPNGATQFYPMAPGIAGGTPTTLPR